ncbi:antA/AntB antirepressor family protein [Bartonella schoenbuchensis]|uniref:Anti-repressor protein n=1 Tax=Bartonella schoenbuchensis m07a TaxID=1094496 RepID=N6VCN6_9HYPH|nr:antA/AntB antirepressor family protein [Bartonella schoenbuchensis]ENN91041.1 anti-repressor protein [Bartonella schoenbuchensis m07a]
MEDPITHQNNTTDQVIVGTVNARKLHEFLKIRTDFNDWITQRIQECNFKEEEDFYSVLTEGSNDNHPKKEYYLTIKMALKLAKVEKDLVYQRLVRLYTLIEQ